MKNLLKKLSEINAAPGFEKEMREFIKSKLGTNGIIEDAYGNLIVHREGTGSPVIVAVPMDVPSVFVTHIEENSYVRFVCSGFDEKKLIGSKVRFNDKSGIVFAKKEKDAQKGKEEYTDMFIDFGEGSIQEAQPGMIDAHFCDMGDNVSLFAAGVRGALCAVITSAMSDIKRDTYFVFLAKTAAGQPSPSVLSFTHGATELIAVDKSRANDYPGEKNIYASLSGGVCLRIMDKAMISSQEMIRSLSKYKDEIKVQKEVSGEKCSAGVLHRERCGLRGVSLGIPTRYFDEICETVSVKDIKAAADIIKKYLNE